jgi:uncharacterized protein (TIGR03437 family)
MRHLRFSYLFPLAIWLLSTSAQAQTGGCTQADSQGTATCTFTMNLNIIGTANGIPGFHAGHGREGTITLVGAGKTALIGWSHLGFSGEGTQTLMDVLVNDASRDLITFEDDSATLSNTGRTGTATIKFGTGAFHNLSGSVNYTFTCTDTHGLCYDGNGTPIPEDFPFSLTGSGPVTLTITNLNGYPPNVQPAPSTPENEQFTVSEIVYGIYDFFAHPGRPIGQIRTEHSSAKASSSTISNPITVGLPLQFFDSTYSASVSCPNLPASCWLSVPQSTGSLPAQTNGTLTASLNPGNLGAGVYPANLSIAVTPTDPTVPASTSNLSMAYIVNNGAQVQVSESAIQFQAVAGATTSTMTHPIFMESSPSLSYQTTASTISGGSWLSIDTSSGTLSTSPATLTISANPQGLAPGNYFGRVDISTPLASMPWQSIPVELRVTAPATAPPSFSSAGLIFVTQKGQNPSPQQINVSTVSNQSASLTLQAEEDNLGSWLKVSPASLTVQSGQPVVETVSISASTLAAGVYTGNVYETTSTGSTLLPTVLIVTPPGTCTPTQLLPVFTNIYDKFEASSGVPVSLTAQIVDDCGNPMTAGVVFVSPTTADPGISMTPTANGKWVGTWLPHQITGGTASLSLSAQSDAGLQGAASLNVTLDANSSAIVVSPGGIVNAANPGAGAIVAPGEFISIFGSNLAPTNTPASSLPLLTSLAGTQVLLGGLPLPLQFVGPNQINAVVPYNAPLNGPAELLISQKGVYSLPEQMIVASAAPAVFTQNQSGQGPASVVVVKSNGTAFVNTAAQPASAGDLLEVYCSGLGSVNPSVSDGVAAPLSPLSNTVSSVTATVGGQTAQVQYSGLAPGFAGLYQVNVFIPQGVAPGSAVPLVLNAGGFVSSPVTVAIQ